MFGEEVNLDNIDREYALNILMMATQTRAFRGYTAEDFKADALIQKLRDVVLNGRDKNFHDRLRAISYNYRARRAGLPFRASVR